MVRFRDVLTRGNKMVWLKVPNKEAVETKITGIEKNILWVTLPRKEGQILVLEQNSKVELGFSFPDGYYFTETVVIEIGKAHGKVYGLLIPEQLEREQRRDNVRSRYSDKAEFTQKEKHVNVAAELCDFSAGGLRVYVTTEFEDILKEDKEFSVKFTIEKKEFLLPVRLVWIKYMDHILNAGFQFASIKPKERDTLMALALKHSRK